MSASYIILEGIQADEWSRGPLRLERLDTDINHIGIMEFRINKWI